MALRRTFPAPGGSALPIIDTQLDFAGLIARDASGAVRSGVLPSHTGPLATARSDLAVDVAAFPVVLVRNGRMILAANDGATRVAVGQPPTANRVIKVIGVRQADPSGTGASPDPEWVLTVGTASDAPDPAAVIAASRAAGAEPVISIEMPAGSYTATTASGVVIRTICRYTAAAGGEVFCRDQADREAFAAGVGQRVRQLDTAAPWTMEAAGWVGPFAARARKSAAQNTNTSGGVAVRVLWDSDLERPAAGLTGPVEAEGIRLPHVGRYWVTGKFRVPAADVYGGFELDGVYLRDTEVGATQIGSVLVSGLVVTTNPNAILRLLAYRIANGATAFSPEACMLDVRYLGRQ